MISYQEALEKILDLPMRRKTEEVPLMDAEGRHLARGVKAPWALPRFTNSAMDGFAVRHVDLALAGEGAPVALEIIGESSAGHPYPGAVSAAQAVRISTGAALPAGATAVVPREHAEVSGDGKTVAMKHAPAAGVFVRVQGSDVGEGEELFAPGTRVTPAVLAFLSSWNIETLLVYTRPKIGILTSGEEIKPHGATLGDGDIVGSSLYYLEREFRRVGCEARIFGISPDDATVYTQMMEELLEWADIAVTTAGVSVGDHDVVGRAVAALGAEVCFWKVAVRPGKPMMVAVAKGKPWFGLPGNPVSTCCNTEIFIKPFLRRLFHVEPAVSPYIMRRLAVDCPRDKHRLFFVYSHRHVEDGVEVVTPFVNQSSGNPLNPARANCLVVLDPGATPEPRGAMVRTLDLE